MSQSLQDISDTNNFYIPSHHNYEPNLDDVPYMLNDNDINSLINNQPSYLDNSDSGVEQLTVSGEEDNLSDIDVESESDSFDLTPEPGISKYIEHKPDSSYPKTIKDEIRLLSVSLDQPAVPFGS